MVPEIPRSLQLCDQRSQAPRSLTHITQEGRKELPEPNAWKEGEDRREIGLWETGFALTATSPTKGNLGSWIKMEQQHLEIRKALEDAPVGTDLTKSARPSQG